MWIHTPENTDLFSLTRLAAFDRHLFVHFMLWCVARCHQRISFNTLHRNSISKQIFHIYDRLMQCCANIRCVSKSVIPPPCGQPDGSVDYEWGPEDLMDETVIILGIWEVLTLPEAPRVHRAALAHDKMWFLVNPSVRRSAVHHRSQTVRPAVIVPSLCSGLSGWNSEA